ncbi:metal-dependent hydrolase [Methanosarcina sp. MSH10X1]|uniref:metal-dependent hydrolase n=1 Tax=Methanosarcina sp. MSH10X1 TaxID=2507075 RepID=UPI001F0C1850|nr:metal-dependent hydrolase [Methanosarcina sp. MSH10X1]
MRQVIRQASRKIINTKITIFSLMFIFGHIGITLGIFYLLSRLSSKNRFSANIPWVAFGALLPDFIDKPLGRIILAETIGSGRIFAHTLLFGLLLGLAGYYLYVQGKPELLIIAGASFCHILEDQMWDNPGVFFWPLFGWGFPKDTISGSFIEYLMAIFNRSYAPGLTEVFISEIIGLLIIILFTGKHIQDKRKEKSIA